MAVTVQDLLKDPRYKDNKSLLLLAKPDVLPPNKSRKKKKQPCDSKIYHKEEIEDLLKNHFYFSLFHLLQYQ